MIKVAILSYQGSALFELGCAVELFGLERPELRSWYTTEVVSFETGPLQSTCNVTLEVKKVQSLQSYSMLIVPSWPSEHAKIDDNLAREIHQFHFNSKTIISFCSGAFLLAELGLLDNRRATTHWRYADTFKRRYRNVEYAEDVLYIFEQTIGTSAGSAAAIDLGLEVIRRDFGTTIANQVARRLVMSPHRKGGQSQFVETPMIEQSSNFDTTLSWALDNLNGAIPINELALRSHMSRRTFDRRFRAIHGCSAKEWLTTQRLDFAKTRLEQSTDSIEMVAQSSGFESANALRHHFRKNFGVSPRQFRDQFSSLTNHLG